MSDYELNEHKGSDSEETPNQRGKGRASRGSSAGRSSAGAGARRRGMDAGHRHRGRGKGNQNNQEETLLSDENNDESENPKTLLSPNKQDTKLSRLFHRHRGANSNDSNSSDESNSYSGLHPLMDYQPDASSPTLETPPQPGTAEYIKMPPLERADRFFAYAKWQEQQAISHENLRVGAAKEEAVIAPSRIRKNFQLAAENYAKIYEKDKAGLNKLQIQHYIESLRKINTIFSNRTANQVATDREQKRWVLSELQRLLSSAQNKFNKLFPAQGSSSIVDSSARKAALEEVDNDYDIYLRIQEGDNNHRKYPSPLNRLQHAQVCYELGKLRKAYAIYTGVLNNNPSKLRVQEADLETSKKVFEADLRSTAKSSSSDDESDGRSTSEIDAAQVLLTEFATNLSRALSPNNTLKDAQEHLERGCLEDAEKHFRRVIDLHSEVGAESKDEEEYHPAPHDYAAEIVQKAQEALEKIADIKKVLETAEACFHDSDNPNAEDALETYEHLISKYNFDVSQLAPTISIGATDTYDPHNPQITENGLKYLEHTERYAIALFKMGYVEKSYKVSISLYEKLKNAADNDQIFLRVRGENIYFNYRVQQLKTRLQQTLAGAKQEAITKAQKIENNLSQALLKNDQLNQQFTALLKSIFEDRGHAPTIGQSLYALFSDYRITKNQQGMLLSQLLEKYNVLKEVEAKHKEKKKVLSSGKKSQELRIPSELELGKALIAICELYTLIQKQYNDLVRCSIDNKRDEIMDTWNDFTTTVNTRLENARIDGKKGKQEQTDHNRENIVKTFEEVIDNLLIFQQQDLANRFYQPLLSHYKTLQSLEKFDEQDASSPASPPSPPAYSAPPSPSLKKPFPAVTATPKYSAEDAEDTGEDEKSDDFESSPRGSDEPPATLLYPLLYPLALQGVDQNREAYQAYKAHNHADVLKVAINREAKAEAATKLTAETIAAENKEEGLDLSSPSPSTAPGTSPPHSTDSNSLQEEVGPNFSALSMPEKANQSFSTLPRLRLLQEVQAGYRALEYTISASLTKAAICFDAIEVKEDKCSDLITFNTRGRTVTETFTEILEQQDLALAIDPDCLNPNVHSKPPANAAHCLYRAVAFCELGQHTESYKALVSALPPERKKKFWLSASSLSASSSSSSSSSFYIPAADEAPITPTDARFDATKLNWILQQLSADGTLPANFSLVKNNTLKSVLNYLSDRLKNALSIDACHRLVNTLSNAATNADHEEMVKTLVEHAHPTKSDTSEEKLDVPKNREATYNTYSIRALKIALLEKAYEVCERALKAIPGDRENNTYKELEVLKQQLITRLATQKLWAYYAAHVNADETPSLPERLTYTDNDLSGRFSPPPSPRGTAALSNTLISSSSSSSSSAPVIFDRRDSSQEPAPLLVPYSLTKSSTLSSISMGNSSAGSTQTRSTTSSSSAEKKQAKRGPSKEEIKETLCSSELAKSAAQALHQDREARLNLPNAHSANTATPPLATPRSEEDDDGDEKKDERSLKDTDVLGPFSSTAAHHHDQDSWRLVSLEHLMLEIESVERAKRYDLLKRLNQNGAEQLISRDERRRAEAALEAYDSSEDQENRLEQLERITDHYRQLVARHANDFEMRLSYAIALARLTGQLPEKNIALEAGEIAEGSIKGPQAVPEAARLAIQHAIFAVHLAHRKLTQPLAEHEPQEIQANCYLQLAIALDTLAFALDKFKSKVNSSLLYPELRILKQRLGIKRHRQFGKFTRPSHVETFQVVAKHCYQMCADPSNHFSPLRNMLVHMQQGGANKNTLSPLDRLMLVTGNAGDLSGLQLRQNAAPQMDQASSSKHASKSASRRSSQSSQNRSRTSTRTSNSPEKPCVSLDELVNTILSNPKLNPPINHTANAIRYCNALSKLPHPIQASEGTALIILQKAILYRRLAIALESLPQKPTSELAKALGTIRLYNASAHGIKEESLKSYNILLDSNFLKNEAYQETAMLGELSLLDPTNIFTRARYEELNKGFDHAPPLGLLTQWEDEILTLNDALGAAVDGAPNGNGVADGSIGGGVDSPDIADLAGDTKVKLPSAAVPLAPIKLLANRVTVHASMWSRSVAASRSPSSSPATSHSPSSSPATSHSPSSSSAASATRPLLSAEEKHRTPRVDRGDSPMQKNHDTYFAMMELRKTWLTEPDKGSAAAKTQLLGEIEKLSQKILELIPNSSSFFFWNKEKQTTAAENAYKIAILKHCVGNLLDELILMGQIPSAQAPTKHTEQRVKDLLHQIGLPAKPQYEQARKKAYHQAAVGYNAFAENREINPARKAGAIASRAILLAKLGNHKAANALALYYPSLQLEKNLPLPEDKGLSIRDGRYTQLRNYEHKHLKAAIAAIAAVNVPTPFVSRRNSNNSVSDSGDSDGRRAPSDGGSGSGTPSPSRSSNDSDG